VPLSEPYDTWLSFGYSKGRLKTITKAKNKIIHLQKKCERLLEEQLIINAKSPFKRPFDPNTNSDPNNVRLLTKPLKKLGVFIGLLKEAHFRSDFTNRESKFWFRI